MLNSLRDPKLLAREVVAGFTTFFTMSYIVIVNPLIWSTPGTGVPLSGALTATVLVTFFMTLIAGLYIKLPYAVAPGMGLNAFIVYSLIIGQKIPWQEALGIVFWASILFMIVSIFPIRQKIVHALPGSMKNAMGCGIGFFLALIGFKNLKLIVPNAPTLTSLGALDHTILLGFLGFIIAFFFFYRKKPYAFLASIFIVTCLAIFFGDTKLPKELFATPDFESVFLKFDLLGSLKVSNIPAIFAVFITNLFDSISSVVGLATTAGFVDENKNPIRLKETLLVDSSASVVAGAFGTSPATVFIESATGIQAGGRTGIASIVIAFLFLPCLFLAPIIGAIPTFSTAPILIFVGILIMQNLQRVQFDNFEEAVPVILTIVLMPLTFSITHGVILGILSYVIVKVICGKIREIPAMLWIIASLCFFSILSENITFKF